MEVTEIHKFWDKRGTAKIREGFLCAWGLGRMRAGLENLTDSNFTKFINYCYYILHFFYMQQ